MDDSKKINIVIVSDDNYVQHAGVMLTSLFESNCEHHFRVFMITDGISSTNKSRLERLVIQYQNNIEFLTPSDESKKKISLDINSLNSGKWNPMIYYKLFIPHILPQEVTRCIFLDVDMVIVDDLMPLYETYLNKGEIIAAVEDVVSCIPRKEILGMNPTQPYINSGVMLCDVTRWREEENKRPIFQFVSEWSSKIINEQDVIAVYMKDKIKLLPIRWNMVGCNYLRQRFVFPKYYPELTEARKYPAIHHFCTLVQPWYADSPHPYRNLYVKYLKIYSKRISENISLRFPYKGKKKSFTHQIRHSIGRILNLLNIVKQPGYVLHKLRY